MPTLRGISWLRYLLLMLAILKVQSLTLASDAPEIRGTTPFKDQVSQALDLLKENSPRAHQPVVKYVGRIQEGERSGMWAYRTPPTYEMHRRTAMYSLTWCAGTIAHDAYHSKLYHEHQQKHGSPVPASVWTGKEAEKACMREQIRVLQLLRAPKSEIQHCQRLAAGEHADLNGDGIYDWRDYRARDW